MELAMRTAEGQGMRARYAKIVNSRAYKITAPIVLAALLTSLGLIWDMWSPLLIWAGGVASVNIAVQILAMCYRRADRKRAAYWALRDLERAASLERSITRHRARCERCQASESGECADIRIVRNMQERQATS